MLMVRRLINVSRRNLRHSMRALVLLELRRGRSESIQPRTDCKCSLRSEHVLFGSVNVDDRSFWLGSEQRLLESSPCSRRIACAWERHTKPYGLGAGRAYVEHGAQPEPVGCQHLTKFCA